MPDDTPINKQLGEAMIAFAHQMLDFMQSKDDVMRQVHTEHYRQVVVRIAAAGFENSLAWHTLGVWTESGKERIGCFSRALDALTREETENPAQNPQARWCYSHSRGHSLYEIARVHVAEGSSDVARDFLSRALPHVRKAERWAAQAAVQPDGLADRILALQREIQSTA